MLILYKKNVIKTPRYKQTCKIYKANFYKLSTVLPIEK